MTGTNTLKVLTQKDMNKLIMPALREAGEFHRP